MKDTIIQLLRSHLSPQTQILKFSNPPKGNVDPESYQKQHFSDMFDLLSLNIDQGKRNLILNRAHLGEYVYAPIYRGYEANWIFDLERQYLRQNENAKLNILILLYDSNNEQLRLREDGKSFSKGEEDKFNAEREAFIDAFEKSLFPIKIKLDLSHYYIESSEQKKIVDLNALYSKIVACIV